MPCLDKILAEIATEAGQDPAFFHSMLKQNHAKILILGYLFNAYNLSELQAKYQKHFNIHFPRFMRKRMIANSRLMHNIKFPLYQTVCARSKFKTVPDMINFAQSQGMHADDTYLINMVLNTPVLLAHFEKLVKQGNIPMSKERFQQESTRAISNNKNNTTVFVRYKMRFLKLWGVTEGDSVADCESGAYEALLFQYPVFESRLHLHNLYKRSIRQVGLKIIAYHKTQRRSVYNQDQEYRKSALEIENADGISSAHDQGWDLPSANLLGNCWHNEEEVLQVRKVMSSPYINSKDKEFFALLSGDTTDDFDGWLTQVHGIKNVDKVVLSGTAKYLNLVMSYTDYSNTRLDFVQNLLRLDPDNMPETRLPTLILKKRVHEFVGIGCIRR